MPRPQTNRGSDRDGSCSSDQPPQVFITGQVATPGAHVLTGPLTVMQLISLAGGLTEFAKKKDITVMRTDPTGKQIVLPFNYGELAKGRNLAQNVVLKPGDTVVVP